MEYTTNLESLQKNNVSRVKLCWNECIHDDSRTDKEMIMVYMHGMVMYIHINILVTTSMITGRSLKLFPLESSDESVQLKESSLCFID